MKKVLLDGKEVDSITINPEKHTFIGMFRPMDYDCMCPVCGLINPYLDVSIVRQHWIDGHFDMPQYKSINCLQLPEPHFSPFENFKYHCFCARSTLYPGKSIEEVNTILDSFKDIFK